MNMVTTERTMHSMHSCSTVGSPITHNGTHAEKNGDRREQKKEKKRNKQAVSTVELLEKGKKTLPTDHP